MFSEVQQKKVNIVEARFLGEDSTVFENVHKYAVCLGCLLPRETVISPLRSYGLSRRNSCTGGTSPRRVRVKISWKSEVARGRLQILLDYSNTLVGEVYSPTSGRWIHSGSHLSL